MIFNNFRLLHLFRRPSSHPILKMVILVNECIAISHIDDGDGNGYIGGDMMMMMVILVVMMMMVILVVKSLNQALPHRDCSTDTLCFALCRITLNHLARRID